MKTKVFILLLLEDPGDDEDPDPANVFGEPAPLNLQEQLKFLFAHSQSTMPRARWLSILIEKWKS